MTCIFVANREDFLNLFSSFSQEIEIVKDGYITRRGNKLHENAGFTLLDGLGFHSIIRCDFPQYNPAEGVTYKKLASEWISQFAAATWTGWTPDCRWRKANGKKLLFSTKYVCKFSSVNKTKPEDRKVDPRTGLFRQKYRNLDCKAWITIKIQLCTPNTVRKKNDAYYLNRPNPLIGVIEIYFCHSSKDCYFQNNDLLKVSDNKFSDNQQVYEDERSESSYTTDSQQFYEQELDESSYTTDSQQFDEHQHDTLSDDWQNMDTYIIDANKLIEANLKAYREMLEDHLDTTDRMQLARLQSATKSFRQVKSCESLSQKLGQFIIDLNIPLATALKRKSNTKKKKPNSGFVMKRLQ